MITSMLRQKYPQVELHIKERVTGGNIVLDAIRIPAEQRESGLGTQIMQELCAYADQNNAKIFCTPSTELGGSSKSRLVRFYQRFGFVLNKGRNKDFSEMQSMVRLPNGGLNESLSRMKKLLSLNENEAFNSDKLSEIQSFQARVAYCRQYFGKPVGAGSSRIVFNMGPTVLKLAKNKKGVAQNGAESDPSVQHHNDIVAQVYKYDDENNWWMVVEKVGNTTENEFSHSWGQPFNVLCAFIDDLACSHHVKNEKLRTTTPLDPELSNTLWEDEKFCELANLFSNYALSAGDIKRINSWGSVQRDGQRVVVLRDYGLNERVWDSHYLKEFAD